MRDLTVIGPGDELAGHVIEARLGEGATGIVFRARTPRGEEPVALKALRPELASDPVYLARFEREARIARSIVDPRLVQVLGSGEADGVRYLLTELVVGPSLRGHLDDVGSLALPDVARLASHLGSALDALASAGLVHRDVKPANVLLDAGGAARLADFGLARDAALTVLTRPGQILGTAAYLAPELVSGGTASAASDLYALGCVLYECLAGRPPFAGLPLLELVYAHLERVPPSPVVARPDVPPSVGDVVLAALAKAPTDRPSTGTLLANLLAAAAAGRC